MNFYKFFVLAVLWGCVLAAKNPQMASNRTAMVHLFEWKWTDIARECEEFLGPKGFGAIQVSPPNEHALVELKDEHGIVFRPWWQRYQPVSYKLVSRSGSESEFKDMVRRCNAVGVRIYVDAVINHMTSSRNNHGIGSAGSLFDTLNFSYPAVPYTKADFSVEKCKLSVTELDKERNCDLVGLQDLDTGKEWVREKLAEYLNTLIDIGVAGFRIDAAKHIWPTDLESILARLKTLREDVFGKEQKAFIYNEVYLNPEIKPTDYTKFGRVTIFDYSLKLKKVIKREFGDMRSIEIMKNLQTFGPEWNFLPDTDAVVFIDNHDTQRTEAHRVLTFKEQFARSYKLASAFMLAWPYGLPQIMSSFNFKNKDDSPPTNDGFDTKTVKILPDGTCGDGWICEHRWRQITNMVRFRNVASNLAVQNWWSNGGNQIAFSRGDRAFIVFNNVENGELNVSLQTGLPTGIYCDIISGDLVGRKCSGRNVTVNPDGTAYFFISKEDENPMFAIHIEAKL